MICHVEGCEEAAMFVIGEPVCEEHTWPTLEAMDPEVAAQVVEQLRAQNAPHVARGMN